MKLENVHVTAAVFAAGLAVVGALLAISAYISTKGESKDETRISGRELIPPVLVLLGLLPIANGIAWWSVMGNGLAQSVGIGVILMVLGALLLRRPEE